MPAALLNVEDSWSMLDGMLVSTLLFANVGSGKSGSPCERMQAAALR
jgi:hypothetical protein